MEGIINLIKPMRGIYLLATVLSILFSTPTFAQNKSSGIKGTKLPVHGVVMTPAKPLELADTATDPACPTCGIQINSVSCSGGRSWNGSSCYCTTGTWDGLSCKLPSSGALTLYLVLDQPMYCPGVGSGSGISGIPKAKRNVIVYVNYNVIDKTAYYTSFSYYSDYLGSGGPYPFADQSKLALPLEGFSASITGVSGNFSYITYPDLVAIPQPPCFGPD